MDTKPLLKWVGGKTQIMDEILKYVPKNINNFYDPFVGGGSVLLEMLKIKISGKYYASDSNPNLINFYKQIQTNVSNVNTEISRIVTDFETCKSGTINRKPTNLSEAQSNKESYYFWIRSLYNKEINRNTPQMAARFLFLNKTCFRGLYRENSHGEFNVPYGNYSNPGIYNPLHLISISKAISGVIFTCQDFTVSLATVGKDDWVYLDPPYVKEKKTSFVNYTSGGFEMHKTLFSLVKNGMNFLLSNSDTSEVRAAFPTTSFDITIIQAKRAINSKKPSSKTNELLIRNK
jgi:DNA adenine methylase